MNVTSIVAFLSAIMIFIATTLLSLSNVSALFDIKSALMVIGGTTAATFICFRATKIITLFGVFIKRVFGNTRFDYMGVVDEIVLVANAYKSGNVAFEKATQSVSNLFLKDCADTLFWLSSEVTPAELKDLLETKAYTFYREYMAEAKFFKTISKFPPAFGLMGTVLGMIALLQSLGESADAKSQIGPAMAIALVTTLYGLALSNFLFVPVAENLIQQTEEDQKIRLMIVEGIMLIQAGKPTKYIEEHVKSFLLPNQKVMKDKPGNQKAA